MSPNAVLESPRKSQGDDAAIELRRSSIDKILVAVGCLVVVVLAAAGVMLQWGANFSDRYVRDELTSQQIFFPSAEALEAEGRQDLLPFAGEQVVTGQHAEAYAGYIGGHLENIAGGQTYSQIPDRQARQDVIDAREAGESDEVIADLEARAQQLGGQRDQLFRGETLRGLLLSSYAWATVGRIAGYAALGAFAGAAVMAVLVVLGLAHLRKVA